MDAVRQLRSDLVFGTATFAHQAILFQRSQHHAKFARGYGRHGAADLVDASSRCHQTRVRRPSISAMKSSCVGYRPAMKNRCRPRSRRWNNRMQSAGSPSRPALPDSW